jgi:hypothetical protein
MGYKGFKNSRNTLTTILISLFYYYFFLPILGLYNSSLECFVMVWIKKILIFDRCDDYCV